MPRFPYWDLKYYYQVHCQKQKAQDKTPVSYAAFCNRLRHLNLHDAIHYPRVNGRARNTTVKATPDDFHRRLHTLNEENVQILDLDKLEEIEQEKPVVYPRKVNRTQIPKPKQNLRNRFISFFKK
jgi:hypothetical protein